MASAMFARFLMVLLIALLPLPAIAMPACHEAVPVAACHEAPAVSAHHGGQHIPQQPQPEPRMAACIGCIPPGTVYPPVAAPAALPQPRLLADRSTDGAPLAAPKPATPPPRAEA